MKHIYYDRETQDFTMWYGEVLVGFAATHRDAETTLDKYVYELLRDQSAAFAAKPSYDLTPIMHERELWIAVEINGRCVATAKTYADAEVIAQALLARKEAA